MPSSENKVGREAPISSTMATLRYPCVLAALCFLATLLGAAQATNFAVHGRVYCDTCRAGFETSATEYIQGAKVTLQCRDYTTQEVLHTIDGVTDASGSYQLEVVDDHEEEICEVVLVSSPLAECSEINNGRDRARILLTHNSGLSTNVRFANSLGFLKKEPLELCGELLKQYGLGEEEDWA